MVIYIRCTKDAFTNSWCSVYKKYLLNELINYGYNLFDPNKKNEKSK